LSYDPNAGDDDADADGRVVNPSIWPNFDQVSAMTLKHLQRFLLTLLLTSLFATISSGVAFAQLPFGNLTPSEDSEEGAEQDGQLGGAPFEQEGPMRPIKLRANWVMLDRNGQFAGTVRGIDGAEVIGMTIFLMNNGRLVKTAAVQEDGSFVFTNVQRGAYSFVGWGDKAFFAFGLNIINETADADKSTPRRVNCGEDDPDHLYGFEGLTNNPVMAVPATSVSGTPVALDSRGRLIGRVHQMNSLSGRPVDLRNTKVMLLKGDNVIGSTTTDNFGIFQFSGVRSGGYGLVAVGVDGVGSVGIQVASDANVMDAEGNVGGGEATPFDFTMVSAETVGWLNHYATEVAYRQAILKPRVKMPTGPSVFDPVCPDGGIPGPDGRCPGAGADNPFCRSPCITYGQWVQNGCACQSGKPALRRIGDRVRDRVEALDQRVEEAFYGESAAGYGPAAGGYGAGYNGQAPGYNANGYVPPIVQPNAAPVMPMARTPQQSVLR